MAADLNVEVVAGDAERQVLVRLVVPAGTTVLQAARQANISAACPGLEVDPQRLGIFGRQVPPEQTVSDGDRVEVYRPLKADPKAVRRALAALAKKS